MLREYGCTQVTGDNYGGKTFGSQFEALGIKYVVTDRTTSQLYEEFEPVLNGHNVVLLDVPKLEQQLLGLVWRGSRIDHPSSEHDDYANALAGSVRLALRPQRKARQATWGR